VKYVYVVGNTAYYVKLGGEDLSHYLNKIEPVDSFIRIITVLLTNISSSLPHIMTVKQLVWWDIILLSFC